MTFHPLAIGFTLAVCVLLVVPFAEALERTQEESWRPSPPMPDDFDWVQLTSGEWLKGEIIAMYKEKLEFDSVKLKLLSLKWSDVWELRSAGTMQVGFGGDALAVGKILVDQETVHVMGAEDLQFPRSTIVTLTAGEPREINYWSFKASLGANVRQGNTEQIETTGSVNIVRRTTLSRINLDYLATFNETDGETASDNQRASISWTRYVSKRYFWTPLYGEWFRDPFQNIAERLTVGAGVGYEIIDSAKIDWEVTTGPAYQSTRFQDVAEGDPTSVDTPAFAVSTTYDHEFTGWMDFLFDYRFFLVNQASGTYTHHLVTGLELELTKLLDFNITLIWDRTKDPQPDSDGEVPKQDDLRMVLALGVDL